MASPFTPPSIPGAAGYPLGLTGATAATRYVGATASGAPASGAFQKGDFVIDQTGALYVCTVAGSPGTWASTGATGISISSQTAGQMLVSDGTNFVNTANPLFGCAPAGAIAETFPREYAAFGDVSTLATGRLQMQAIWLPKGVSCSSITFVSGTTAATLPLNQLFGLYNSSRALLRGTTDDTSTAWAAAAAKTLALTSAFVTTYAGLHYVAILVVATTVPTLLGTRGNIGSAAMAIAPIYTGSSTSAITALPDPAGAITAGVGVFYAYVS